MKRSQKGITFLSFVIVLVVIGFFGFLAMRLFPVYQEYYSAVSVFKSVTEAPGAASESPAQIRVHLDKRFQISYIENINLEKDIKFKNEKSGKTVQLKYEVRRPLMYNIDFVAKFDKVFPLSGGNSAASDDM